MIKMFLFLLKRKDIQTTTVCTTLTKTTKDYHQKPLPLLTTVSTTFKHHQCQSILTIPQALTSNSTATRGFNQYHNLSPNPHISATNLITHYPNLYQHQQLLPSIPAIPTNTILTTIICYHQIYVIPPPILPSTRHY